MIPIERPAASKHNIQRFEAIYIGNIGHKIIEYVDLDGKSNPARLADVKFNELIFSRLNHASADILKPYFVWQQWILLNYQTM